MTLAVPPAADPASAVGHGPPTLYLHGSADGCISADLVRDAERHLSPGSQLDVIPDAGHFLHLERPAEVSRRVLAWVTQ